MSEDSIFDEINEEVKHDQFMAFVKKYKTVILSIITLIVVGILAHSSFYNRKLQRMQDITTSLVKMLQYPSGKSQEIIKGLVDIAPEEIKPSLEIAINGEKIVSEDERAKALNNLLEISNRENVDLVWRDLASLVYLSHSNDLILENRIDMLKKLTEKGRPFRFSAKEMIGAAYMQSGYYDEAESNFLEIINDEEAPKSLKKRVTMILSYMKNNLVNQNK